MPTRFLKPERPYLVIRHPETQRPLAAEGETVEFTSYWRRRLRDGDVVEAKPPKAPPERKPPAPATAD